VCVCIYIKVLSHTDIHHVTQHPNKKIKLHLFEPIFKMILSKSRVPQLLFTSCSVNNASFSKIIIRNIQHKQKSVPELRGISHLV
jgi:hypothetical protein